MLMGNRDQVVIRNASGAITRLETYGYDAQNRLTSISSSEGTIHYAYDPITGQLTDTWTNTSGAVDPAAASSTWIHYSYDSLGRLWKVTARRLLATECGSGRPPTAMTRWATSPPCSSPMACSPATPTTL